LIVKGFRSLRRFWWLQVNFSYGPEAEVRQSSNRTFGDVDLLWHSLSRPSAALFKMPNDRLDIDSAFEKNFCKSNRIPAEFWRAKEEQEFGCVRGGCLTYRSDFSQLMFGQHRKRHD
jgi:hypothetical protein